MSIFIIIPKEIFLRRIVRPYILNTLVYIALILYFLQIL